MNQKYVDSSLNFMFLWKQLLNNDYTIFAIVTLILFFDTQMANIDAKDKSLCRKFYKKYLSLLEHYCTMLKQPLLFMDIVYYLNTVHQRRELSAPFLKEFVCRVKKDSRHTEWMYESWLKYVNI